MGTYKYRVKSWNELEKRVGSFFDSGEVGSVLLIKFMNTDCFVQFAIDAVNTDNIEYRSGFPVLEWSRDLVEEVTSFLKLRSYDVIEDTSASKADIIFYHFLFRDVPASAITNVVEIVSFFEEALSVKQFPLEIVLDGNFYGKRTLNTLEEAYLSLEKGKKLGILGKLIFKLLGKIKAE